jgi:aquaporin Z
LWAGGRFPAALLLPYSVAQVLGGIAGATVLYLIASGRPDFSLAAGFASNGYGAHSPGEYSRYGSSTSYDVTRHALSSFRQSRRRTGASPP